MCVSVYGYVYLRMLSTQTQVRRLGRVRLQGPSVKVAQFHQELYTILVTSHHFVNSDTYSHHPTISPVLYDIPMLKSESPSIVS